MPYRSRQEAAVARYFAHKLSSLSRRLSTGFGTGAARLENMMRHAFAILVSLFVLLSLSGCATKIAIPSPAGEDDCLVLIKTEVINHTVAPIERSYTLKLSSGGRDVFIPTTKSSFAAFVVREPATRIKTLTIGAFSWGNLVGEAHTYDMNYILPYRPGYAVVADIAFLQTVEEMPGGGYMSYFDTRKVEDSEKASILETFAAREGSSAWQY
jgi:hypothetical protein